METRRFREIVKEVCTVRLSALGFSGAEATDHGQVFASDRVSITFSTWDEELWIEFGLLDPAIEYFGSYRTFSLIDIAALENLKKVNDWSFVIDGAGALRITLEKCLRLFSDALLHYVMGDIECFRRLSFYSEVLHLHYNFRISDDFYKREYVKRIAKLSFLGFDLGYHSLVVLALECIQGYLGQEELELLERARKLSVE